jgi:hypothetical protein
LLKLKQSSKLTVQAYFAYLRNIVSTIDWKLLIFLLLFLNVKMAVKVVAIIFIFFFRFNFQFGFKLKDSRLPLFYLIMIGLGIFNWVIDQSFTKLNYDLVMLTGILCWLLCILAIHQIKISVEQNKPEVTHRTIAFFFILNTIVSLITYAGIIWKTSAPDPFIYQGEFQKYFIGTGDYIKGISFDTSTTNALLSAFGVFYFLSRGKGILCLLCMVTLLLTGSNFINILFCCILIYAFIFQTTKDQKSVLIVCMMLLILFLAKVSPQNEKYITQWYHDYFDKDTVTKVIPVQPVMVKQNESTNEKIEKDKIAHQYLDSLDKMNVRKKQNIIIGGLAPKYVSAITAKPEIPQPNINAPTFQYRQDTTAIQKTLLNYISEHHSALTITTRDSSFQPKYPGKVIALQQTFNYLNLHPQRILTGTGIANFSSKLAFRATALKIAGGYPEKYAYFNNSFIANHFDLYLYYFSRLDKLHSLTNTPNSTYDQLLSEYGLLGLAFFFIFYIGYFTKHIKKLDYGIPLLLLMLGAFFIDYWFEQLSIVVIFELLLLLNIKETTEPYSINDKK